MAVQKRETRLDRLVAQVGELGELDLLTSENVAVTAENDPDLLRALQARLDSDLQACQTQASRIVTAAARQREVTLAGFEEAFEPIAAIEEQYVEPGLQLSEWLEEDLAQVSLVVDESWPDSDYWNLVYSSDFTAADLHRHLFDAARLAADAQYAADSVEPPELLAKQEVIQRTIAAVLDARRVVMVARLAQMSGQLAAAATVDENRPDASAPAAGPAKRRTRPRSTSKPRETQAAPTPASRKRPSASPPQRSTAARSPKAGTA